MYIYDNIFSAVTRVIDTGDIIGYNYGSIYGVFPFNGHIIIIKCMNF
jgi:hypothetical protein